MFCVQAKRAIVKCYVQLRVDDVGMSKRANHITVRIRSVSALNSRDRLRLRVDENLQGLSVVQKHVVQEHARHCTCVSATHAEK